jgi:hypothetical protein
MWIIQEKLRPVFLGRSCSVIMLSFVTLAANGAVGEIIKKQDLLRGFTISRAQCEVTSQTVWLTVEGWDFCVRYYLSTAGGEGSRPVVFLPGDRISALNPKTWTWIDPSKAEDIDTDELMNIADMFSKMAKTTAIYLARIGADGTSGNHIFRKTILELHLMNAALDAIKRSHAFEGFHLAGQSGGSKIAMGLIGLRRDISCLVVGSGPFASFEGGKDSDHPERSYFDDFRIIPQLAQDRSMRVFLVTDKMDKYTPAVQQTGFSDRLRRAGRQIPQFFVEATDDTHHNVFSYTELVIAGCVLGRSDEEIARALGTIAKRNAEYNERRRKEIEAKASIVAAGARAVPDTGSAPSRK